MSTEISQEEYIEIYGAKEHNLKNVDLKIPRNKLVVFTGLSGSGKSSLAFDTIFAEGQRRYIETFSAYARQFLGGLERPHVDEILGLSPVISIEQKTVNRSPRSTVGTVTEVYDFMRLLYARVADAYSYNTGEKMVKYTDQQIIDLIIEKFEGQKIVVLSPKVKGRKGHYRELFEQTAKLGYSKVRVDGEIKDIVSGMKLDRYKIHDIEIVIDRIQVSEENKNRVTQAVQSALKYGQDVMMVEDFDTHEVSQFSRFLMCPTTGISYAEPEPNLFSFNSPYGACKKCNGIGTVSEVNLKKVIPDDKLSIKQGAIEPLGKLGNNWISSKIEFILEAYGFSIKDPVKEIDEEIINKILYGFEEVMEIDGLNKNFSFEGITSYLSRQFEDSPSPAVRRWVENFMNQIVCDECNGSRLKKEADYFKINDKNIGELASLDLASLSDWFKDLDKHLTEKQLKIGREILKEINNRMQFLMDVGLHYLALNRSSKSLSGGEAQRIRLATQIGSELVNVLYILDEPSIGLHQRDNTRLINSLKKLRDAGNSVIVVEHDKEMMEESDFIVDIGPKAGLHGGEIVQACTVDEMLSGNSTTAAYLKGDKKIEIPDKRRKGNGEYLELIGANGHNLKNINVKFPLGKFICVTGVSGSGKSTLVNHTLYPILNKHIYKGVKKPLEYSKINGLEHIDKVIDIDQSPIGRTPRSNPATYTGVFSDIRNLFANTNEAKIRGYKAGRFSFNVKGGRCETCKGGGLRMIEMNFLPDVYVECEECQGKRYNRETLEVRFKGKNINDVLEMTIEDAAEFFESIPKIRRRLETLNSVGMGYVKLGQPSTTLSGGEAQRIKLATELSKKSTGKTFFILDEPSTGLHFDDIRMLLNVLQRLVDEGNTVLVIEHNLDIVKVADHIIDIGPDGGVNGGEVVGEGSPEEFVKKFETETARYLIKELE
ncbi:excinuclease ABC subunit UvrA [Paracrocinitomix mangrovi]|uniref:excinuclease ABC subunit UvrA n=1 Tax=Paracrocinitomix mangrovi TaxID=2862509 RepID=UPI001C8D3533|nr:excinuclease ABC subunit UvrA [Paracrocinitomix mangrovi]UKN02223.1 excinuclease ABC subunit UvrA [Paracrocinitomix mangrovi]